ncbi:TPA: hypothetical protein I8W54_004031, partial [Morganella morganii]|nr:hypothetical protein [Morganella morganii]
TINTLLQGRDAMQEMLDTQRGLVISSEEELEISRQLNKQNAQVRQGWEGLKTLLANYLMPSVLKFSEKVSGFLMFLNKNRDTAVMVFKGIGIVLGVLLIPMVIKAATAFLGMFAAIGLVPLALFALGAGLWLLYDDFKKWKEGGKSLLGEYWKDWDETITPIVKMLDDFRNWFKDTTIGKWFTDQDGNLETWKAGLGAAAIYFGSKFVKPLSAGISSLSKLFRLLLRWPMLVIAGFSLAWYHISKLKDLDLSPLMAAVGEAKIKFDDLTKSINMFRDAKNGIDKVQAGIRAGSDLLMGGNLLKIGIDNKVADKVIDKIKKDGFAKSVKDAAVGAYSYLSSAKSGDTSGFTASGVDVPHWNKRIFKTENGDVKREGGSRSWRNNNPGNIEYGDFAKKFGAIGTDGRFAIFPTEEAGRKAKEYLIFESNGGRQLSTKGDYGAGLGYKNKTLSQMLTAYAPKEENITNGYIKSVLSAVGVEKRMGDYTSEERSVILEAMKKVEGWDAGDETRVGQPKIDAGRLLANLTSFNQQISQPLTPNAMPGIQQTMANSQALQSSSKSVTYNIDSKVENLNVNTSSSTISGAVSDGSNAWRENLFQTITPMS